MQSFSTVFTSTKKVQEDTLLCLFRQSITCQRFVSLGPARFSRYPGGDRMETTEKKTVQRTR